MADVSSRRKTPSTRNKKGKVAEPSAMNPTRGRRKQGTPSRRPKIDRNQPKDLPAADTVDIQALTSTLTPAALSSLVSLQQKNGNENERIRQVVIRLRDRVERELAEVTQILQHLSDEFNAIKQGRRKDRSKLKRMKSHVSSMETKLKEAENAVETAKKEEREYEQRTMQLEAELRSVRASAVSHMSPLRMSGSGEYMWSPKALPESPAQSAIVGDAVDEFAERVVALEIKLKQARSELSEAKTKESIAESEAERQRGSQQRLRVRLEQRIMALEQEHEAQREQAERALKEAREQLHAMQSELETMRRRVRDHEAVVKSAQQEVEAERTRAQALEVSEGSLQDQLVQMQSELLTLQRERTVLAARTRVAEAMGQLEVESHKEEAERLSRRKKMSVMVQDSDEEEEDELLQRVKQLEVSVGREGDLMNASGMMLETEETVKAIANFKVEAATAEVQQLKELLKESQDEAQRMTKEVDVLRGRNLSLEKTAEQARGAVERTKTSEETAAARAVQAETQLSTVQRQAREATQELEEAQEQLQQYSKTRQVHQREIAALQNSTRERLSRMSEELATVRQRCNALQTRNSEMHEEHNAAVMRAAQAEERVKGMQQEFQVVQEEAKAYKMQAKEEAQRAKDAVMVAEKTVEAASNPALFQGRQHLSAKGGGKLPSRPMSVSITSESGADWKKRVRELQQMPVEEELPQELREHRRMSEDQGTMSAVQGRIRTLEQRQAESERLAMVEEWRLTHQQERVRDLERLLKEKELQEQENAELDGARRGEIAALKKELEEYDTEKRRLRSRIREVENQLLELQKEDASARAARADMIREHKAEIQTWQKTADALREQIELNRDSTHTMEQTLETERDTRRREATKERQQRTEFRQMESRLRGLERRVKERDDELAAQRSHSSLLQTQLGEAREAIHREAEKHEKQLQQMMETHRDALLEARSTAKEGKSEVQSKLSSALDQVVVLESEVERLKTANTRLDEQHQAMHQDKENAEEQLKEAQEKLLENAAALQKAQDRLQDSLRLRKEAVDRAILDTRAKMNEEDKEKHQELSQMEDRIVELEKEIAALKEKLELKEEELHHERSIRTLNEQKLKGMKRRVSRLSGEVWTGAMRAGRRNSTVLSGVQELNEKITALEKELKEAKETIEEDEEQARTHAAAIIGLRRELKVAKASCQQERQARLRLATELGGYRHEMQRLQVIVKELGGDPTPPEDSLVNKYMVKCGEEEEDDEEEVEVGSDAVESDEENVVELSEEEADEVEVISE